MELIYFSCAMVGVMMLNLTLISALGRISTALIELKISIDQQLSRIENRLIDLVAVHMEVRDQLRKKGDGHGRTIQSR